MSMSPKVYEIDGIVPVIDETAFVHPDAVLIGDVIVGPGVYVGPACCLRGDFGRLILEEGSNIQDTCVMHGFPGTDTVVKKTVTSVMGPSYMAVLLAKMRWWV